MSAPTNDDYEQNARRAAERLMSSPAGRRALLALEKTFDAVERGINDDQSEALPDMIGAPVVAQFRSFILLAKEFLTKQDKPGTHAKAIHLVDSAFDLLCQVGVRTAAQHIFYAAVRNAVGADVDKPPWYLPAEQYTAAGAAGLLRGEAALHELITSHLLPSDLGSQMAIDAHVQSGGDESSDRPQGRGAQTAKQTRHVARQRPVGKRAQGALRGGARGLRLEDGASAPVRWRRGYRDTQ